MIMKKKETSKPGEVVNSRIIKNQLLFRGCSAQLWSPPPLPSYLVISGSGGSKTST